jgi:hypothetical protein
MPWRGGNLLVPDRKVIKGVCAVLISFPKGNLR